MCYFLIIVHPKHNKNNLSIYFKKQTSYSKTSWQTLCSYYSRLTKAQSCSFFYKANKPFLKSKYGYIRCGHFEIICTFGWCSIVCFLIVFIIIFFFCILSVWALQELLNCEKLYMSIYSFLITNVRYAELIWTNNQLSIWNHK